MAIDLLNEAMSMRLACENKVSFGSLMPPYMPSFMLTGDPKIDITQLHELYHMSNPFSNKYKKKKRERIKIQSFGSSLI